MRALLRQNTVNWSMSITNDSLPNLNENKLRRENTKTNGNRFWVLGFGCWVLDSIKESLPIPTAQHPKTIGNSFWVSGFRCLRLDSIKESTPAPKPQHPKPIFVCFVFILFISLLTQLSTLNKIPHLNGAHRGRSSESIHVLIRFF